MESQTWKQKLLHGFSEYLINVGYLTIFFCVYALSRRLTLAQYGIHLDDYFIGLIKAIVIGKVIMIGAFFRVSQNFEDRALIIPTLYKAFIFILWIILFDVLEVLIRSLLQAHSPDTTMEDIFQNQFSRVWLGGMLMVFVCFIPFFALKELSRIMGHEKFRDLFFKARTNELGP